MSSQTAAASRALEIPSLDGFRAVSFLMVFFAHAGLEDRIPGGFGVTVFFFLSGYLITTLLRLEWEQHGEISLRDFYLRRALRILPPFYIVLAISTVLTVVGIVGLVNRPLQIAPIMAQALHVTNYWTIARGTNDLPFGTGVYWSLAVEEHFYLIFPAVFVALHRLVSSARSRAIVLIGTCLAVLAWRCLLVYGLDSSLNRTYMGTDTRVDSILWGCALALWGNPMLDESGVSVRTWSAWLLPIGLLALLFSFLYRDAAFRETWRYSLQGLALVPVFVVGIRRPELGPFRLLNVAPLRWLGVLSYSLYLIHHVVLGVMRSLLSSQQVLAGVLSFVISVGLAYAIHIAVERPCARLRRRLSHAVVRTARGTAARAS